MSEIKLLPCPFCGGEAEISINKTRQGQTSNVRCTKCTCKKTLLKYPFYEGDIEKDAIEDWNTRKPMERIIERLNEKEDLAIKEMSELDNDKYASEYECGFAGGESSAFCNAIRIVKEEGGIE